MPTKSWSESRESVDRIAASVIYVSELSVPYTALEGKSTMMFNSWLSNKLSKMELERTYKVQYCLLSPVPGWIF